MIPLVQFDPATLALWTSTGTLQGDNATIARELLAAAIRGDDPLALIDELPVDHPFRLKRCGSRPVLGMRSGTSSTCASRVWRSPI
jgi:hypothetical protein